MMNYEMFKKMVAKRIARVMPEEFQGYDVRITSVNKINQTLDALSLVPVGKASISTPTLYLNDMYEEYAKTEDFALTLRNIAGTLAHGFEMCDDITSQLNLSTMSHGNIIMALINTAQNKELLAKVPHRALLDLSIIYRWVVAQNPQDMASAVIDHSLAAHLGLDESQLYTLALKNTREKFPPTIKSMIDVMREIMRQSVMPAELLDDMEEDSDTPPMYILSNRAGINGATSMVYEDELMKLAEKFDSDIYLLPSSIHEVIAVSVKTGTPQMLSAMVLDVNQSQVDLCDRLSNQVYQFNRATRKLCLVTDAVVAL